MKALDKEIYYGIFIPSKEIELIYKEFLTHLNKEINLFNNSKLYKIYFIIKNINIIDDEFLDENKILNMLICIKIMSFDEIDKIKEFFLLAIRQKLNKWCRSIYSDLYGEKVEKNNINIFDDYCSFKKVFK